MSDLTIDQLKQKYDSVYKETTTIASELEETLKGEEEPTEIITMLLENSVKVAEEQLDELKILESRNQEFGEGIRKQIAIRLKFVSSFLESYKVFQSEGCTTEAYLQFKYEFLMLSKEFTGSKAPKPPAGKQQQEPAKQQIEQAKPPQQLQPQPEYKKPIEKKINDNKQQQPQLLQPPSYQQPPTMYQPPPPQKVPKQNNTQYNYSNQNELARSINLTTPKPNNIQKSKQPIPIPKKFTKTPLQQTTQNLKRSGQFQEDFDSKSQSSSHSCKDFPFKENNSLISKVYEGVFIPYDDRQFEIFNEIYTPNGLGRIKRANLRNRYSIFESTEIQIGFDSSLIFHEITNRYFLRLRLCFGNKTTDILQNFQYSFEGDSSMGIWAQDPIYQNNYNPSQDQFGRIYLNPKEQIYIPICINYNRIPYEIISGTFSYETTETSQKKISHFIIPCLLTKFMIFRDISVESFQSRWLYKEKYILKSEQARLNPKIIKSPDDFLKSFGPNNVHILSDVQEYLSQSEKEMMTLEYGLNFTFGAPQIEFLLKIIVFPNYTVLFQIIPYQSYITQAETLLNTLIFLFCLPD